MALNAAQMAEEIVVQLEAISAPITDRPRVLQYWTAVCTGIINHFHSNAEVLPGTFANSAGPVTGEGTIL